MGVVILGRFEGLVQVEDLLDRDFVYISLGCRREATVIAGRRAYGSACRAANCPAPPWWSLTRVLPRQPELSRPRWLSALPS